MMSLKAELSSQPLVGMVADKIVSQTSHTFSSIAWYFGEIEGSLS